MCLEATPPPSARVTRRGVLAGAAALAGTLAAAGPAAAAAAGETHPSPTGPRPLGGSLVIRGGTLLD
ncbi:amidohydrolase family protein, partial [Streptomyces sp. NPDC055721]